MKFESLLETNIIINEKFDKIKMPFKMLAGVGMVLPIFFYPPWTYILLIPIVLSRKLYKHNSKE